MRNAFTVLELVFVIVIIGILSAIALPKFAKTSEMAYDSKAKNTVASVRSVIATERQKMILRGSTDDINYTFLGDAFANVLSMGVKKCNTTGCGGWETTDTTNASPVFTYHSPSGTDVKFKLENNKLVCKESATICKQFDN